MSDESLHCWVYRSSRKQEMYLYLAAADGFDRVPAALLERFGRPSLVMELELSPQRPLAREEVAEVMRNLRESGFHLQLPPRMDVDLAEDRLH